MPAVRSTPAAHSRKTFLGKVGLHHFAHLRAVAEGVPVAESAMRYLGIEHGHQAVTAHRAVVQHLRALSRRRGDKAWRLVGLTIRLPQEQDRPSLEDFVADRELEGWSESEVQELYAEAFPLDAKAQRRQKLRERQLTLLWQLQQLEAEVPSPADRLDGWFEPELAQRLERGGILLLSDLQAAVSRGGRWWRSLPGIGPLKAARLAQHLNTLLPLKPLPRFELMDGGGPAAESGVYSALGLNGIKSDLLVPGSATQVVSDSSQNLLVGSNASTVAKTSPTTTSTAATTAAATTIAPTAQTAGLTPVITVGAPQPQRSLFDGRPVSTGVSGSAALIGAQTDAEAIEAWVAAKAGSIATAKSYRREALRLLIWLQQERRSSFTALQVEDCLAYMAFLEHIPPDWISRRHSTVLGEGWAPFRGPLSLASRQQAVVILGGLFAWLVDVGYLPGRNPWMLVNRRTGDDASRNELDSRAFTPQAWQAMLAFLNGQPSSAARDRVLFLLGFVEATGLRASELVQARLSAFKRHRGRWAMQVHGKGARNRVIAVPGQAVEALESYLQARGLPAIAEADPALPLLASTKDPLEPIGYQALYQTLKTWIRKAILASDLPRSEREDALRASPHWLRHTFGTRALERQAPLEVVQRQLGHADPRTTMRYAKAQLERLQSEMDAAFSASAAPSALETEVDSMEVAPAALASPDPPVAGVGSADQT